MLHFYSLADDQSMPSYPKEGEHKLLGSLDDQIFERLKVKKIIPERFDYYSDFRWSIALIQQIRVNILNHPRSDSDVQSLLSLLHIANSHDSGLVAYAD